MRQPKEQKLTNFQTELRRRFNRGNFTQFTDAYDVKHKPGVSLYVPVNGSPMVVVLDSDKATAFLFEPLPGSGTDAMRARMEAQIFFDRQPTIH